MFTLRLFQINSREISLLSAFIAIGAVSRILLGNLALDTPIPIYGVIIAIGLTETLTFICGFVFGYVAGFVTGAFIIIISDMVVAPGAWTPFIAAIIGLFGVGAAVVRKIGPKPSPLRLGCFAVALTIMSEVLQNLWTAWSGNLSIPFVMIQGLPTLIAALINNAVLIATIGPRVIKLVESATVEKNKAKQ